MGQFSIVHMRKEDLYQLCDKTELFFPLITPSKSEKREARRQFASFICVILKIR